MARARDALNIAVKISNESRDRTSAFILLFGEPSAFNDGGGKYQYRTVAGAAFCKGAPGNPRLCVGYPSDTYLFPLQQYTEIEPGKSINVHFQFVLGDDKGQTISLTQEIAYRFTNFDKDSALSDAQKLKTLRFGALSFTDVKPLTPDVNSSINFDKVK